MDHLSKVIFGMKFIFKSWFYNIFPVFLDLGSFLPFYIFIIHIWFFIFFVTDGDLPILATRLVYFWFVLPFWTCWSKRPGSASRKCFFRKCVRIKWKYYKYLSNHCETRYWTKYQRKPMAIQLLQVKFLYFTENKIFNSFNIAYTYLKITRWLSDYKN